MNEHNPDLPGGSGDPQLSRLYRGAPAEVPPPYLDVAIQAAARRAAGARPRAAGATFLRTWRVPLSIAAVLVLSVSMVTLTVRQKGGRLVELPPTASVPAPRSEPAAAPVPPTVAADIRQKSTRADLAAGTRESAAAKREMDEVPVRPQAFSTPAESVASTESRTASAPQAAVEPAGPAAKLRAQSPAAERSAVAGQEPVRPEALIARRDRAAAGMSPGAATDSAPVVAALVRELEKESPEKWLEKITLLQDQSRTAEAGELLAEFRKRYPDHPLPAALR